MVLLPSFRLLLVLVVSSSTLHAADWPHWRGGNRNGIVSESSRFEPGKEWVTSKPQWVFEAGEGSTSPLVVGGSVYVMGWKQSEEWLYCLEIATGKTIWSHRYVAPKHARFAIGDQRRYGGTTATPEFDAATGFLFTLGCDGELRAWDPSKEGRLIWRKNLYDEYAVRQRPKTGGGLRDYGYTTSPLVMGDHLIVEVGAETGTLAAFDPKTGRELWTSEYERPAGHTGGLVPMLVDGYRRSPDEYRELARVSGATAGGPGDAWCHVTLADSWVLCKNRMGQLAARRLGSAR